MCGRLLLLIHLSLSLPLSFSPFMSTQFPLTQSSFRLSSLRENGQSLLFPLNDYLAVILSLIVFCQNKENSWLLTITRYRFCHNYSKNDPSHFSFAFQIGSEIQGCIRGHFYSWLAIYSPFVLHLFKYIHVCWVYIDLITALSTESLPNLSNTPHILVVLLFIDPSIFQSSW